MSAWEQTPLFEALAAAMTELGVGLLQLSRATGFEPRYLRSVLEGEVLPSRGTIELLARGLGVEPERFLDYRLGVVSDRLHGDPGLADEVFLKTLTEIERASVDTSDWSDRPFAEAVRALLAEEELTQGDLAETMGISQSELSQTLHGRRRFDLDLYALFADSLGVRPEHFLSYRLALIAEWLGEHPADLDRLFGELDAAIELAPYDPWPIRTLSDPRDLPLTEVAKSLVEIVEVEGPILGARAYRLRLMAAGIDHETHELRRILNRASYAAIHSELLVGVNEREEQTQKFLVLRKSGTPMVRMRQRGDRSVSEIPAAEIRALVTAIRARHPRTSVEELHRELVALYEIVQPRSSDIEHINRAINIRSGE